MEKAQANGDDSRCPEAHKAPKTKGEMDSGTGGPTASIKPTSLTGGDCSNTRNERSFDKPDDKRHQTDPDLAKVTAAWPRLPKVIKTAITAMVEASK